MARSLLGRLSPKARVAYPIIKSGVRSGLTFNEIRSALKRSELGITSAELSPIVRYERELVIHGYNLKFLPMNRRPNPARLPTSITSQRSRYLYTVQVFGYMADTGETFARYVNVASDELITRAQAEDQAATVVLGRFERYKMEVESTQLSFVQKASVGFARV